MPIYLQNLKRMVGLWLIIEHFGVFLTFNCNILNYKATLDRFSESCYRVLLISNHGFENGQYFEKFYNSGEKCNIFSDMFLLKTFIEYFLHNL